MLRILIIVIWISCSLSFSYAQKEIVWETLADVSYSYVQNYEQNFWYGIPTFGEEIKALEGKEILIKGYVLPMDVSGESFVLSAFPFSSCFFCGGAGQESVIELRLKKKNQTFKTDQVGIFKGVLKLNDQELELNYILDRAELVDE